MQDEDMRFFSDDINRGEDKGDKKLRSLSLKMTKLDFNPDVSDSKFWVLDHVGFPRI